MKTISRAGNKLPQRGFTLFEILAVVGLIAVILAVGSSFFSTRQTKLRNAAHQLTQDIQGTYFRAIKKAKVYRIFFKDDRQSYVIQEFELPKQRPKDSDKEALAKWEQEQREIDSLPMDERTARTRLDRGTFKDVRKRTYPSFIRLKEFFNARLKETPKEDDQKESDDSIFFYPSGEMDQALIVLEDGNENYFSLKTEPLSGKVTAVQGEISEQDWKEKTSSD